MYGITVAVADSLDQQPIGYSEHPKSNLDVEVGLQERAQEQELVHLLLAQLLLP